MFFFSILCQMVTWNDQIPGFVASVSTWRYISHSLSQLECHSHLFHYWIVCPHCTRQLNWIGIITSRVVQIMQTCIFKLTERQQDCSFVYNWDRFSCGACYSIGWCVRKLQQQLFQVILVACYHRLALNWQLVIWVGQKFISWKKAFCCCCELVIALMNIKGNRS